MTVRRHSLRIAGHPTSVSLEDAFWQEIRRAAREDGVSTARLVEMVDHDRMAGTPPGSNPPNLSSALRLFVLARLKAQSGGA